MPNPEYFREIPLDEAIAHFNEYYNRVKDTNEIDGYIISLDDFISPEINADKIDDLKSNKYIVFSQKGKSRWKLDISSETSVINPATSLTDKQIYELQKFNNYLREDDVVAYLKFSRRIMIIVFIIVVIGLIYLIVKGKWN